MDANLVDYTEQLIEQFEFNHDDRINNYIYNI